MTDKKTNKETTADEQVEAQTAAEPTPAPESTPAQPSAKGSKTGAIAIALVIALGGGLYYHGHQQSLQQNAKVAELEQQISQLKGALDQEQQRQQSQQQLIEQVQKTSQGAEVSISQQEKSISGLQTALAEVKGRRPNDWLLAEADYLVKMAGRKLWLEHDTVSATVLLESADHRVAELNDPNMTPIRRAMHQDITTLKAVPRIDQDGLVLRLTTLQQQLATLPLANAILAQELAADQEAEVSKSIDDWKENLKTSLKNFSENFITYRTREGSVIPLLSPKQNFYLQENIKSKIETAIKSVYREQGELYVESLKTAKEWASQFYDMEDPAVQSFISTLDKLAAEKVETQYPAKLESQSLISDALDSRLRQQIVAPLSTEEDPA